MSVHVQGGAFIARWTRIEPQQIELRLLTQHGRPLQLTRSRDHVRLPAQSICISSCKQLHEISYTPFLLLQRKQV